MRRRSLTKAFVIAIAALAPFTLAKEPLPPPYHQYILEGTIRRASNGSKAFFVVSMVGKFRNIRTDSAGDLTGLYSFQQGDRRESITDTSGAFSLQVSLALQADSLALRVTAPDKPVIVGSYFGIPDIGAEITGTFDETEPGCSGCSRNPVSTTQVLGYRYNLSSQTILLPY